MSTGIPASGGTQPEALRQPIEPSNQPDGQYRLLFDHNPLPMWVIDRETLRFVAVNTAAVQQYGYSREEFLGMTVFDLHPIAERASLSLIVAETTCRADAVHTSRHQKKDGALIDVEITAQALAFAGRPARLAMAKDISGSKQVEKTLRESEDRFRLLIEGVKDYTFTMLDPSGHVVSCFAGAQCIAGYTVQERLGQRCSCFFPREDAQRRKAEQELHMAEAQGRHEAEGWRLHKDGLRRWVNVVTTPLWDAAGKLRGFAKVMHDITGQHRAIEEMANMSKFPDENSMPVLRLGANGVILYANKASDTLLRSWRCRRDGSLSEHPRRIVAEALSSGKAQQAEFQCAGRVITLSFLPILEPGYVNVYGHDITDQRRLERELLAIGEKERRRIGQELHDGLCQEISGIAYRVNNLHKKLACGAAAPAADVQTILEHLNLAKEQTRDLARLLNPVSADPEGLMSSLNHLANNISAMFKVSCRFQCDRPVKICDLDMSNHLFRITQEAISNAIRHGQADHIMISLRQTGDALVLRVKNNGAVFSGAVLKRAGMGIDIMRYRARAIGAILDIRSGARGGAALTCSLPLFRLTESNATHETKTTAPDEEVRCSDPAGG